MRRRKWAKGKRSHTERPKSHNTHTMQVEREWGVRKRFRKKRQKRQKIQRQKETDVPDKSLDAQERGLLRSGRRSGDKPILLYVMNRLKEGKRGRRERLPSDSQEILRILRILRDENAETRKAGRKRERHWVSHALCQGERRDAAAPPTTQVQQVGRKIKNIRARRDSIYVRSQEQQVPRVGKSCKELQTPFLIFPILSHKVPLSFKFNVKDEGRRQGKKREEEFITVFLEKNISTQVRVEM